MKFYEINGKRNLCGDRIREARQKRRLSQSELCKLLQLRGIMVERDVISRMESGARIVTDFEAVAMRRCWRSLCCGCWTKNRPAW